jgi:GxxExxY protein
MEHEDITGKIIACAYKVHNTLGAGFLEKVYERAFKIELERSGFKVNCQVPLVVCYNDQPVGNYYADLLVNDEIVIELKALECMTHAHEIQLVHYLNAIKKDFGLLINFGSSVQVKRKYRLYKKTHYIL